MLHPKKNTISHITATCDGDDRHPATFPGKRKRSRRRDDDAHVRSRQLSSEEVCLAGAHEGHLHQPTRDRLDALLEFQKTGDHVGVFHVDDQRSLTLFAVTSYSRGVRQTRERTLATASNDLPLSPVYGPNRRRRRTAICVLTLGPLLRWRTAT